MMKLTFVFVELFLLKKCENLFAKFSHSATKNISVHVLVIITFRALVTFRILTKHYLTKSISNTWPLNVSYIY